jgi:serine/threonine protein kinase
MSQIMGQALGDRVGEILAGRYQVQQQLGKKAGRRTLLALDLETQEQVVIKLLLFSQEFEWDDLKLFEREANTLQTLSHPAIPRYLNHFELDNTSSKGFGLVQTFIAADSLEDHLKAGRSFSAAEIEQLARALLEILSYLHEQHPAVIHRDIKPSNILLANRSGNSVGQLYLVDFGSVQTLAAREGGTITVVGTYGYMPPEQFGGRAVPASDLYSLGATLIYLVTGQHPADLPQTDLRIEFEAAQLQSGLTQWLRQMTEPSLNRRFTSVQAALKALDAKIPDQSHTGITFFSPHQPKGSKVLLTKSADMIAALLPPARLSGEIALFILFALACNLFTIPLAGIALYGLWSLWSEPSFPGFLLLLFSLCFSLPLMTKSIKTLLRLVAALFVRTQIRIDSQTLFFTYRILGFEYNCYPASRQEIGKLVYSYRFHKVTQSKSFSRNIGGKPRIVVWAGRQKYEFGEHLTEPELDWLALELSEWLGLPVTQERNTLS